MGPTEEPSWANLGDSKNMADKPAPAPKPDLTPFFILFLIVIVAGLGSVRSCEYTTEPPSNRTGGGGGCAQPLPPDQKKPSGLIPNYYTVLVGSFKSSEQACAFAADLRRKNINNFTVQTGGGWLICVGTYVSEERAKRTAGRLEREGIGNPVVLPPKKK
jgi:hypothetical protein